MKKTLKQVKKEFKNEIALLIECGYGGEEKCEDLVLGYLIDSKYSKCSDEITGKDIYVTYHGYDPKDFKDESASEFCERIMGY